MYLSKHQIFPPQTIPSIGTLNSFKTIYEYMSKNTFMYSYLGSPVSETVRNFDDPNYCQLSLFRSSYPKNDHVWRELSQNSTEVTKVTKTIKSFEISSSPSAICCWKM